MSDPLYVWTVVCARCRNRGTGDELHCQSWAATHQCRAQGD